MCIYIYIYICVSSPRRGTACRSCAGVLEANHGDESDSSNNSSIYGFDRSSSKWIRPIYGC